MELFTKWFALLHYVDPLTPVCLLYTSSNGNCVHLVCVHRQECKKLREELREDHEDDKRAALSQLAQNKEQELGSARESWQRKVEDLLEQVRDSPPSPCCTNWVL